MNLANDSLALPLIGMFTLTMLVWLYMFVRRMSYIAAHKLEAQDMKTPAEVENLIPDEVAASSHNLRNLFEVPVIFYAVCLYLMLVGQVDQMHVYCAWGFLAFRVLHSLIHCSYNAVIHRFAVYIVSCLALWVMVVRALMGVL